MANLGSDAWTVCCRTSQTTQRVATMVALQTLSFSCARNQYGSRAAWKAHVHSQSFPPGTNQAIPAHNYHVYSVEACEVWKRRKLTLSVGGLPSHLLKGARLLGLTLDFPCISHSPLQNPSESCWAYPVSLPLHVYMWVRPSASITPGFWQQLAAWCFCF